jgi:hypothetical protein
MRRPGRSVVISESIVDYLTRDGYLLEADAKSVLLLRSLERPRRRVTDELADSWPRPLTVAQVRSALRADGYEGRL